MRDYFLDYQFPRLILTMMPRRGISAHLIPRYGVPRTGCKHSSCCASQVIFFRPNRNDCLSGRNGGNENTDLDPRLEKLRHWVYPEKQKCRVDKPCSSLLLQESSDSASRSCSRFRIGPCKYLEHRFVEEWDGSIGRNGSSGVGKRCSEGRKDNSAEDSSEESAGFLCVRWHTRGHGANCS